MHYLTEDQFHALVTRLASVEPDPSGCRYSETALALAEFDIVPDHCRENEEAARA